MLLFLNDMKRKDINGKQRSDVFLIWITKGGGESNCGKGIGGIIIPLHFAQNNYSYVEMIWKVH